MKLNSTNAHLFWGGIFSQWTPSRIVVDGVSYNCNEQYMMASKAMLFGDDKMYVKIMEAENPSLQKAYGRQVAKFDSAKWNEISRLVVYRANLAKFTQNCNNYKYLMETGDKIIVEASPEDKIWGIGLHASHPDAWDTEKWQGTNWLGEAIMQVRSDIRDIKIYCNI